MSDWQQPTRRATVPGLEAILYEAIPVLDHGFVRVVDYMGDDAAIVQAARVSYGRGTKQVSKDAGLINYLMRHRHTTPFEMCEIKFHIKLPIFVARQWIRHRTANVNEYSARYSVLDKEFYVPASEHLAAQSASNRQGRGAVLQGEEAQRVLTLLREDAARCYNHYEEMLNEREDGTVIDTDAQGLARELARMNLPLNIYTQWYWKIDLHNLLHFCAVRSDAHAQYEIRAYSEILKSILKLWVPLTYAAFESHVLNGAWLSSCALEAINAALSGGAFADKVKHGMTDGEWDELVNMFPGLRAHRRQWRAQ
jgi:thymidylate synthase (FAD)